MPLPEGALAGPVGARCRGDPSGTPHRGQRPVREHPTDGQDSGFERARPEPAPTFTLVRGWNRNKATRGLIAVACAAGLLGPVVHAARASTSAAAPVGGVDLSGVVTTVCANSGDRGRDGARSTCGGQANVGGVWQGTKGWVTGRRWQCVEFAQRVYGNMGWWSGVFPVDLAFQIYDRADDMGMLATPDGTITSVVPGDMIIINRGITPSDHAGHVLVVARVDGATVTAEQQNTFPAEVSYTLGDGRLTAGPFVGHIRGIVHSPLNPSARSTTPGS